MPVATLHSEPEVRARRLMGAVLEAWAADCLRLRAAGLDRPSRRGRAGTGRPLGLRTGRSAAAWSAPPATPRWAA